MVLQEINNQPLEIPMVSIHIITYNHEKFIQKTIESALSQITQFQYELVIGDDCSTDNTQKILIDFKTKYPSKIKLLLHTKNLGPKGLEGKNNFVTTLKACTGKYIALLDGDDYWTNDYKLQKQIDILETNSSLVGTYHDVEFLYDTPNIVKNSIQTNNSLPPTISIVDALKFCIPPTSSFVFRNIFSSFPKEFYKVQNGDFFFHCMLLKNGTYIKSTETMSSYRIHTQSYWSQKEDFLQKLDVIDTYIELNNYFKSYQRELILDIIHHRFSEILTIYLQQKKHKKWLACYVRLLVTDVKNYSFFFLKTFLEQFKTIVKPT